MFIKFLIYPVIFFVCFMSVPALNMEFFTLQKVQAQDAVPDNYYNPKMSLRWENPSLIKVYIEDNSDKSYLMKRAFYIWNNEVKLFNFYFVDDEKNADIVCKFIYKMGEAVAGTTHVYPKLSKDGEKLVINKDKKVTITIAYSNDAAGRFTNNHQNYLTVILHEIGHALGITYHSNNKNDIMYPTANEVTNQGILSQRDINTMKMIYAN